MYCALHFFLIDGAMVCHGFDIEETHYDIIKATPLLLWFTGSRRAFTWHGARSEQVETFPRSKTAAYILMGSAASWFLYLVLQLGPSILDNIATNYLCSF